MSLYRGLRCPRPVPWNWPTSTSGPADFANPGGAAGRLQLSRSRRRLNALEPVDREVLVLRHFEQLTNEETAQPLGIGRSAASKRYVGGSETAPGEPAMPALVRGPSDMSSSSADRDPIEILADEFIQRRRRGERPSLAEYGALSAMGRRDPPSFRPC